MRAIPIVLLFLSLAACATTSPGRCATPSSGSWNAFQARDSFQVSSTADGAVAGALLLLGVAAAGAAAPSCP